MADFDVRVERARFQEVLERPTNDMERAFKAGVLDAGSEPREWSDEIVSTANYFWRIFAMGWNACINRAATQQAAPLTTPQDIANAGGET